MDALSTASLFRLAIVSNDDHDHEHEHDHDDDQYDHDDEVRRGEFCHA